MQFGDAAHVHADNSCDFSGQLYKFNPYLLVHISPHYSTLTTLAHISLY
jgi:hypothetical protein